MSLHMNKKEYDDSGSFQSESLAIPAVTPIDTTPGDMTVFILDAAGTTFSDEHIAHILWDKYWQDMGIYRRINHERVWEVYTGIGNQAVYEDLLQHGLIPEDSPYYNWNVEAEFEADYRGYLDRLQLRLRPAISNLLERYRNNPNVVFALNSNDTRGLLNAKCQKLGWMDAHGNLTENSPFLITTTASEYPAKPAPDMCLATIAELEALYPNKRFNIVCIDDAVAGRRCFFDARPHINPRHKMKAVIAYPNNGMGSPKLYSHFEISDYEGSMERKIERMFEMFPDEVTVSTEFHNHAHRILTEAQTVEHIFPEERSPFTKIVQGRLCKGYGAASGTGEEKDNPFGASTILLQKPHFYEAADRIEDSVERARILHHLDDIFGGYYYIGTVNVKTDKFFLLNDGISTTDSQFTLRGIRWADRSPEDFTFAKSEFSFEGQIYSSWIYYPHPWTKNNTENPDTNPHKHDFGKLEYMLKPIDRIRNELAQCKVDEIRDDLRVELGLLPSTFTIMDTDPNFRIQKTPAMALRRQ